MSNSTLLTSYNFYINSSQRSQGVPADYNVYLTTPLYLNGIVPSEFRFVIHYVQVPFCFSQFNQYNFTTSYSLLRNSITYTSSFNITTGNYNVNTFITEWIRALKASLTLVASYTPLITGTYSADTNLITFTMPSDSFADTVITFQNSNYKAVNLALGFNNRWTLAQNSSTTSQIDVNVSPSRNLYLTSDTLIQSKAFDALTTSISVSPVLAVIPIQVTPNNYITFYYNPPISSILNNTVIDKLNFQLKDESLTRDLVDFDLDYTLYFTIEEHRTDLDRNTPVNTLSVNPSRLNDIVGTPQEIPAIPQEQIDRRNRLMKAREKVSKKLIDLKDELEKSI